MPRGCLRVDGWLGVRMTYEVRMESTIREMPQNRSISEWTEELSEALWSVSTKQHD